MNEIGQGCAHQRVTCRTSTVDGLTFSQGWRCDSCPAEFLLAPSQDASGDTVAGPLWTVEDANNAIDALRAEVRRLETTMRERLECATSEQMKIREERDAALKEIEQLNADSNATERELDRLKHANDAALRLVAEEREWTRRLLDTIPPLCHADAQLQFLARPPLPEAVAKEVERVRGLEAISEAAHHWDHWGKVKVLHVLTCKECERLEGAEQRWCAEATKIAKEQLTHAKALQAALAQSAQGGEGT